MDGKGDDGMSSMTSQQLEAAWRIIRERLEARQNQIYDDIAKYPPPIPACDQHFNYLLEQRAAIAQDLRRQKALAKESLASRDPVALIGDFLASSAFVDKEAKQHVAARLANI